MTKHYTILELLAENIKRLTVVRIRPSGKLVQITGKNGHGKTSVLDSIWWALAGADNIQEHPINDGASEARVRLDLGEIVVTRHFKRKDGDPPYTTRLTVEAADGARFPSPQTMLDQLIGRMSFDPLAFSRLKPREQFDMLKGFVVGVDLDKLDQDNKTDYERRTTLNRKAAELRAQKAGIDLPVGIDLRALQPVDERALVAELEEAGEKNVEIEKRRQRRLDAQNRIDTLKGIADKTDERIADHRAAIERLLAEGRQARAEADGIAERLARAPQLDEPVDTTAITEKIRHAGEANEKARKAKQWIELETQAEQHEAEAKALTNAMQARTEEKQAAIAAAQMPVEGLGFGDGEITLNGQPWAQASDAEQLRTSVAIAIAMNPQIRVVRVRDGSLLDEDGIRLVAEMAEKHDCQVWIERVDNSGRIGFVMEDGHLKEANP